MATLEEQIGKAVSLEIEPVLEEIRAEGGGVEGLATIIERVVMPLIGAQRQAIVRLAREIDELRAAGADDGGS